MRPHTGRVERPASLPSAAEGWRTDSPTRGRFAGEDVLVPVHPPCAGRLWTWVSELAAVPREIRATRVRVPFVHTVLPKGGVGAELGVFKGRFSPVLLRESQATCLHLIDPWYLLTPTWHWGRGDRSTVNALRRILKRWRPEIEAGRIKVHVGDDRQVLASFPDHCLDWVYLDSSHAYEHTAEELRLLHRTVKPGGVIAGDDWQPDPAHKHHGVHRAVTEFAAAEGYDVVYANESDQQWAITRRAPSR